MGYWADVCGFDEIPRQGATVVWFGEERIAVFRTFQDHIFAVEDRCPHKGGHLSDGLVHGNLVTCPLHNLVMDLGSGKAVYPDEGCVRHYKVRLEKGVVQLFIPVLDRTSLAAEESLANEEECPHAVR